MSVARIYSNSVFLIYFELFPIPVQCFLNVLCSINSCDRCGKRFAKSHHLKAHMNTHDRMRPRLRGLMSGDGDDFSDSMLSTSTTTATAAAAALISTGGGLHQQHHHPQTTDAAAASEFIVPHNMASVVDADGNTTAVLYHGDETGDLMMDIAGQIITDDVTGENYVLDMSELEEDAKATVHLIHFNANDLGN